MCGKIGVNGTCFLGTLIHFHSHLRVGCMCEIYVRQLNSFRFVFVTTFPFSSASLIVFFFKAQTKFLSRFFFQTKENPKLRTKSLTCDCESRREKGRQQGEMLQKAEKVKGKTNRKTCSCKWYTTAWFKF